MKAKIGINGLGRIGRMVLRSIFEENHKNLKINHINNRADIKIACELIKRDSVHGKFKGKVYIENNIPIKTLSERIRNVLASCFNGKRIVVFSGGSAKDTQGLLNEVKQIHLGGGFGSIIGRNSFQRPRDEALKLLSQIIDIYKGK